MECWSAGILEYWSIEVLELWKSVIHYSNTHQSSNPPLQQSITPHPGHGLRVRRSPLWLFPESLSSRLLVFSVFGGVLAGAPESAGLATAAGAGVGDEGVLADEGVAAGSSGRLWRRRSKGRFFCSSSGVPAFPSVLPEV